ncbi:MAG: hypothetical protein HYV09_00850 [Deltaproteobacteria bacterium]|nr:hypothetical protein [Deltaproteobacteria bacterium]
MNRPFRVVYGWPRRQIVHQECSSLEHAHAFVESIRSVRDVEFGLIRIERWLENRRRWEHVPAD